VIERQPDADRVGRGESVYRTLRKAILEGKFQPGQRIREAEIGDWLGVSRTPVREALHRLEQEDLLVNGPNGLAVPKLDLDQVLELYALREIMEGSAAAFAAQRATEADIEILKHLVRQESEAGEDLERRYTLNQQFHFALHNAAHNRYLLKTLGAILDAFRLMRGTPQSLQGRLTTTYREHMQIVKAVSARDPAAAEAAARKHVQEARRNRLMRLFGEVPKP